jgi:hypothetical protein
MHAIARQLLSLGLGAALTAVILITARVFAQTPGEPTDPADVATPEIAPATVSTINAGAAHFINYQGQLFNPSTGQPLGSAVVNLTFRLYGDPNGNQQLWQENKSLTTNPDGTFNTELGSFVSFNLDTFDGRELYLGVAVNGQETRPLQRITYVPYAFWARNADKLSGFGSSEFAKIIAYGFVDDDGDFESGRGFDSERDNVGGVEVYVIDFDNENDYNKRDFTTIVTPACNRPVFVGTGSSDGDLIVDIWDSAGNRTECEFQFMTLMREE